METSKLSSAYLALFHNVKRGLPGDQRKGLQSGGAATAYRRMLYLGHIMFAITAAPKLIKPAAQIHTYGMNVGF